MLIRQKCKKCRAYGQKLLLNERCASNKCALIRRGTRPGVHGRKPRKLSEYARQLIEKQKLRFSYLLKEKQLKKYFKLAQKSKEPTDEALMKLLEKRLDNVIYRAGYVPAKTTARQLVVHGHFLVNGRKVNIPSFQVKPGDLIEIKPKSKELKIFKDLNLRLRKYQPPAWLEIDKEKFVTKVIREPQLEDIQTPVNLDLVINFYSRH